MRGIRYRLERVTLLPMTDRAFLDEGQAASSEALAEGVLDIVDVSLEVTVGGVTMHLAAWRNPEHWADDWRAGALSGVDHDDVPGAVAELLAGAVEET